MSEAQSVHDHKQRAPHRVCCAVVTVSDTRTPQTDLGGPLIMDLLRAAGHVVLDYQICKDDPEPLSNHLAGLARHAEIQAILVTGGTGVGPRDHAYQVVLGLFDSEIPGYGELFRMLSYEEIGSAAILSRATAGLIGSKIVATMPGSPAGVRLAMERILLPELPHLVAEANRPRHS